MIVVPFGNPQFAGHDFYDNEFVCLQCKTHHPMPKGEWVGTKEYLDKCHAHLGHAGVGIWPHKLLSALGLLLDTKLRHNADIKIAYAATAAYTITLTGLAGDANLLAGRESTAVANTSNYLDELVSGFIATGTSPTAGQIEAHVVGTLRDTPAFPDVFDGTDSAETITTAGIKNAICSALAIIATTATSSVIYAFKSTGIRQFFGDGLPTQHVIFVTHNTVVTLHATAANHGVHHTPVYGTIT